MFSAALTDRIPSGWSTAAGAGVAVALVSFLAATLLLPSGPLVNVRWVDGISQEERSAAIRDLGLEAGEQLEGTTWQYELPDPTRERLTALVRHPSVDDTHRFDLGPPLIPPVQPLRPGVVALLIGLATSAVWRAAPVVWVAVAWATHRAITQWTPALRSSLARRNQTTLFAGSLVILAAAVHGPYLSGLGFYWDEWPLVMNGMREGGQAIAMSRGGAHPLAFQVWGLAYGLFGPTPWPYHLWVFLARLVLALGVAWTAACLWPRSSLVFASAALALVYPGFLHVQFGFLYVVGMSFAAIHTVSLGASLAAHNASSKGRAVALSATSVVMAAVTGFGLFPYLTLAEVYRLALMFHQQRQSRARSFKEDLRATLIRWTPYGAITASLFVWATFLRPVYHPEREVQAILAAGLRAPGEMAMSIAYRAFTSLWTLAVGAWTETTTFAFAGSTGSGSAWGAIAGFGVAFTIVFWTASAVRHDVDRRTARDDKAHGGAVLVGLVGLVAALLPIVLAGLHIDLGSTGLDRYSLVAIGASGIFTAGCLHSLVARRARVLILAFMVAVAAFPHHSMAADYRESWSALRGFVWQTAWRVPDLAGTMLVQRLPLGLSGRHEIPSQAIDKLRAPLRARYPALQDVFMVGNSSDEGRLRDALQTLTPQQARQNVLILSQAAPGHCVQALSGRTTDQRPLDGQLTRRIGSVYSNPHLIAQPDSVALPEPVAVFGPEPDHGFCYQFQMASAAIQREDWGAAVGHWEEVQRKDLIPATPIEWMPFADALLMMGQRADAQRLIARIRAAPEGSAAWCRYVGEMRRRRERPSALNSSVVGCRPARSSE